MFQPIFMNYFIIFGTVAGLEMVVNSGRNTIHILVWMPLTVWQCETRRKK